MALITLPEGQRKIFPKIRVAMVENYPKVTCDATVDGQPCTEIGNIGINFDLTRGDLPEIVFRKRANGSPCSHCQRNKS